MRSNCGLKTVPKVVFAFVMVVMMVTVAFGNGVPVVPSPAALLWYDPVGTWDIALSSDGQYVVVAALVGDGVGGIPKLQFYGRSSATPLWIWSATEPFISVAISADGDCVVAGGISHVFFWRDARTRTSSTSDPTWSSTPLGPIGRRDLDISGDGNYVVAGGTGINVYYWANAKSKAGVNIAPVLSNSFIGMVEAVDLSSNGDYVAAVSTAGEVAYWKNARTNFQPTSTWKANVVGEIFNDVAISDDGNYIAASSAAGITNSVFYWAGATGLSGNPSPSWRNEDVGFFSVDMSSDGGSVIAGAVGGVYFWSGARGLSGTPTPTWTYSTGPDSTPVWDVAIDDAGDYMAASTALFDHVIVIETTVYFFDRTGNLKWSWGVDADKLSISSNGATLAVGTPVTAFSTAYLLITGFHTITVGAPVGGFMERINTLRIAAPYLALFGVMAAVAVVVWKKRDN
jgi:hypothetical protein